MTTIYLLPHETFDWTSPDQKVRIIFYVTPLLKAIENGSVVAERHSALLDPEWAKAWLTPDRVNADYALSLPRKRLAEPLLGAWMPHGTMLLIDGSHRYYERLRLNMQHFDVHIVPYPDWRRFAIITGDLTP
jgi:hypothetical protein